MTAVALSKRWPVRASRIFLVLAFTWNLAYGIFSLSRGRAYGLICLALVLAIAGTLAWQAWYLRRAESKRGR